MKNKKGYKVQDKTGHFGFTLAEVLITLTIIGVIAAILFPSILANYTERTLKAKRSAFVARMSQAMAELSDQFANFEDVKCDDNNDIFTCTDNASALKFISNGLSKVYKIASICDKDGLAACDVPDIITKQDGSIISLYESTKSFKDYLGKTISYTHVAGLKYKNLLPAAFMTKNGESVLVFVNPACSGKTQTNTGQEALMCVNMIFDLNGAKGKPNKVGEDIWVLGSFYSDSPTVAAPKPYDMYKSTLTESTKDEVGNPVYTMRQRGVTYFQADEFCKSLGENVTIPSYEEAATVLLNLPLFSVVDVLDKSTPATSSLIRHMSLWTMQACDSLRHRIVQIDFGSDYNDSFCWADSGSYGNVHFCVYDD